jgi:hypothetical protein
MQRRAREAVRGAVLRRTIQQAADVHAGQQDGHGFESVHGLSHQ